MTVKEIPHSSAIERVTYNEEARRLSIWFRGGRRYTYSDVPPAIYTELCECGSAGRFVCEKVVGQFMREGPWKKYGPNARRD